MSARLETHTNAYLNTFICKYKFVKELVMLCYMIKENVLIDYEYMYFSYDEHQLNVYKKLKHVIIYLLDLTEHQFRDLKSFSGEK